MTLARYGQRPVPGVPAVTGVPVAPVVPVCLVPGTAAPGRRRVLGVLTGAALLPAGARSTAARAQGETEPRAGIDYRLLRTPQVAPTDRLQVLEFFYYGCPFCARLEPLLPAWRQRQPADVMFDRVPVIARDSWVPLGRLYYTLVELDRVHELHGEVYRAIHDSVDGAKALSEYAAVSRWAGRKGIARDVFTRAWEAPAVQASVQRARQMTDDYDIQATPSIVIDGRLLSSSGLTRGVDRLLPVVDQLLAQARSARK